MGIGAAYTLSAYSVFLIPHSPTDENSVDLYIIKKPAYGLLGFRHK